MFCWLHCCGRPNINFTRLNSYVHGWFCSSCRYYIMLSYKDVFPFRYDSFYIILLHPMVRFRFFRVPPTCMLFGGTVPPMSVLFGGTVPPACVLFEGTVPQNNQSLFEVEINSKTCFIHTGFVPHLYEHSSLDCFFISFLEHFECMQQLDFWTNLVPSFNIRHLRN